MTEQTEAGVKAQKKDGQERSYKSAAEGRLEVEMRGMQENSARDKAALERVRRKLTRLMLVSLTVTFIALAVVATAIIYKIAHTRSVSGTAAQNSATIQAAPAAQNVHNPLSGIFIQTAPKAQTKEAVAREAQEEEAKQAKTADNIPLEQKIPLAAGERLEEAGLSSNFLLLRITAKDRKETRLLIYDFAGQRIIARIKLANPE